MKRKVKMKFTPAKKEQLKHLKQFVGLIREIKSMRRKKIEYPKWFGAIGVEIDPIYCRHNPVWAARQINATRDVLLRTIAHCDAAKHANELYQKERPFIVDVAFGCEPTFPLAPPPAQVPDGFVLVPREPTKEMIEAGELTDLAYVKDKKGPLQAAPPVDVYRAMLSAAAPTPPAQKDKA